MIKKIKINLVTGYRVFEDGKRCRDHNIEGWTKDTFATHAQAIKFAHMWAYPLSKEDLYDMPLKSMSIDVDYDMSMSEHPVMIRIEQVVVHPDEITNFEDL